MNTSSYIGRTYQYCDGAQEIGVGTEDGPKESVITVVRNKADCDCNVRYVVLETAFSSQKKIHWIGMSGEMELGQSYADYIEDQVF